MMTQYYRFSDLKALGYFNNRMSLKRAIDARRFAKPVSLGPNTRAWTAEMLAEYDARLLAERDGKAA